ncbi:hypothetical protein [Candidatus Desulforudis audaxviator]|uniref:hypothetical protein n=1 Tax=Candidatus Desulforudis audaxviator TaxID=471827 RepID=UPI00031FA83E|nr:hypothetical protein [Candidatus Desulforudis audaxviator]
MAGKKSGVSRRVRSGLYNVTRRAAEKLILLGFWILLQVAKRVARRAAEKAVGRVLGKLFK